MQFTTLAVLVMRACVCGQCCVVQPSHSMHSLFNFRLQTERNCSLSGMSFCLVSNELDANNGVKRRSQCMIGCLKRLKSVQVELELRERKWTFTRFFGHALFIHTHAHLMPFYRSFIFFCSLWRLCGPLQGHRSLFCPVSRSRLFSTRCLRSETSTRASLQAWRPGWVHTAWQSPAQAGKKRWNTLASSWWWETCSWKW